MSEFQKQVSSIRNHIDHIDHQILSLLAQRFRCVKEVGVLKNMLKEPMMQTNRVNEIIDQREKVAQQLGLPKNIGKFFFQLLLKHTCAYQDQVMAELEESSHV